MEKQLGVGDGERGREGRERLRLRGDRSGHVRICLAETGSQWREFNGCVT